MADEVVPAQAAPETVETASTVEAPVSGETKPESQPAEPETKEKLFSQTELERIVGERLSRAERKLRREFQQSQRPPAQPEQAKPETAEPKPENFSTTEEYINAVADYRAEKVVHKTLSERESEQRKAREQEYVQGIERTYQQREAVTRVAIPDYDDVVYGDDSVWVSDHPSVAHLATTVKSVSRGSEIAYHLGKNREEFSRIAKMPPREQAIEVGILAAKLPDITNTAKQTTSAPSPIKPLGGSKGSQVTFTSTDDPRAAEKLTPTEWIHLREKEKREKLKAQGYR